VSSLRRRIGALLYEFPIYLRTAVRGRWTLLRNRREVIATDGRGVRCEWEFTSDLHLARVFPRLGRQIMNVAFREWPISLRDAPRHAAQPDVSFIIGHRGLERLPHLLAVLRSVAGQEGASVECIVVEQSSRRDAEPVIPSWVRYVHRQVPEGTPYNRSAAFNEGVRCARGSLLVLHDGDLLVPSRYAAEAQHVASEGWRFLDLKRFLFYIDEDATGQLFSTGELPAGVAPVITQNARGGSIVVTREAFESIGGFDDEFSGWGGEDNDFWDRASAAGGTYGYGYLPFVHLDHPAQEEKLQGREAAGIARYHALRQVPAEERTRRLLARREVR
jgi:hypothetical protein